MKFSRLSRAGRRVRLAVGLTVVAMLLSAAPSLANGAPIPGSGYYAVAPVRLLDTRIDPLVPLQANVVYPLEVSELPDDLTALALNITVVDGTEGGYLVVYGPEPLPPTSTVNWDQGVTVANSAVVAVEVVDGTAVVNLMISAGSADVVIDLLGAYGAGGVAGPAGPAGADGATGPAGPAGPAGADGATGLAGPAGPAGADGAAGAMGIPGLDGAAGAAGVDGATGPAGPAGADGAAGPAGADGAAGPAGIAGPAGADGAIGATGPAGDDGDDGTDAVLAFFQATSTLTQTIAADGYIFFPNIGFQVGGINANVAKDGFTAGGPGLYKVTLMVNANQSSQLRLLVNGVAPTDEVFGAYGGYENFGIGLLQLLSGDVVTLQNISADDGDNPISIDLAVNAGGTADSVNASILVEQLVGLLP